MLNLDKTDIIPFRSKNKKVKKRLNFRISVQKIVPTTPIHRYFPRLTFVIGSASENAETKAIIYLFIYLSIHLFFCLFIYLFVYLS